MPTFLSRVRLPVDADTAFDWHARPGAFERLTPPWEAVELRSAAEGIREGSQVEFVVKLGPWRQTWIALHQNLVAGRSFEDVQVRGPFSAWTHTHTIEPHDDSSSLLEDRIAYALPGGWLGERVAGTLIRQKLERMFAWRRRVTCDDLKALASFKNRESMNVFITGSSGLIGSTLAPLLTMGGHTVVKLVRRPPAAGGERFWDSAAETLPPELFEGAHAVVHLAGENIGEGRWTEARKRLLRDSRIRTTRAIATSLAALPTPPQVLVVASAIGIYGDRGEERLDEGSDPGTGFLADLCCEWEAAADAARERGIRVVHVRLGIVLSSRSGALKKMLLPFKLGVGGNMGSGRQYWSWIAIDDAAAIFQQAVLDERLSGPVNAVAPETATNHEFTKTLGCVLQRPTVFPMPAFAARLVLGEMADALILCSARVEPTVLQREGYDWRYPELESALRHVLGREAMTGRGASGT